MSGLVHDVVVVGGGLTGLATAWRVPGRRVSVSAATTSIPAAPPDA